MKTIFQGFTLMFILSVFAIPSYGQTYDCVAENNQYRYDKNQWVIQDTDNPFTAADIADFEGLFYYPVDCNFVMNAVYTPPPSLKIVPVGTEAGGTVQLYDYGTVTVQVKDKTYQLQAYKNIDMAEFRTDPGTIFIPFKDQTSGNKTFDNGRYLIIQPPQSGNEMIIDFNMATNPYQNYNTKYTSLLVPDSNVIQAPIQTGERKYEDR